MIKACEKNIEIMISNVTEKANENLDLEVEAFGHKKPEYD